MNESRKKVAKEVLEIESEAVSSLIERIDDGFSGAVDTILESHGKVVVTGIGKSGIIGQKLASTLSSTGTPSFFLHPAESAHGDLGMISKGDVVIAISYGGGSAELNPVIEFVKRNGIKMVAVVGNRSSRLAEHADFILDISVNKEACPLNLAPTASSTATLAMCDALAMVVLNEKGFKEKDFAEFHPGGSLGKKLLTKVKDVLPKSENRLPIVGTSEPVKNVVDIMTTKDVRGVCGVVDEKGALVGVVTDGDVRRWLRGFFENESSSKDLKASDLMSKNPKVISENELAQKALYLMEQFSISSLFVIRNNDSGDFSPIGVLHIQDLLDAQIT